MFKLEALNAAHGDALLLQYGDDDNPRLAVIDGGPSPTYQNVLKPRLMELRNSLGLSEEAPMRIDLLVVTHIDDDHINGVVALSKDLVERTELRRPRPWIVRRFWHNSFEELAGSASSAAIASQFGAVASAAAANNSWPAGLPMSGPALALVASVKQGRDLRDNARKLNWSVNNGKTLITRTGTPGDTLTLDSCLKLTILGPDQAKVDQLEKDWHEHTRKMSKKSAAESKASTAEYVDKSVYNLSSIIVLCERSGKQILLTGDARGDEIVSGLKHAGLNNCGRTHVDVLKLPHHGSVRDINADFFRQVTADRYIISANGKYSNPDIETLRLLTEARGTDEYDIYMTNPVPDAIDFLEAHKRGNRFSVHVRENDNLSIVIPLQ